MAKVFYYIFEGAEVEKKPGVMAEGVELITARTREDLTSALKQAGEFDLFIFDSVPKHEKVRLIRSLSKLRGIPVIFFEQEKSRKPKKRPSPLSSSLLFSEIGFAQSPAPRKKTAAGKGRTEEDPLEKARRFMDDHFKESLSLEELAARAGMSPSYFCRRFKNAYGVSPVTYLRNLRLDRAKHLLENTNLPLAAVAEQSGFLSPSYFCREFKKATRVSPMQYRREQAKPRNSA